ncbi:hypothetical protein [Agrococcus casei]|uniref:hypothetical protein n=2 Tax=Agrococcus casei TaxID=343512 RepID=UPI003F913EE1
MDAGDFTTTGRRAGGADIEIDTIPAVAFLAEELLTYLEKNPEMVHDDSVIDYGWSPIRLTPFDDVLVAQVPNVVTNPRTDVTADLSTVLWVRAQQWLLAEKTGLELEELSYLDDVQIAEGWRTGAQIHMRRHRGRWLIAASEVTDEATADETLWSPLPSWELLRVALPLAYCLWLPEGTTAVVDENEILEIRDGTSERGLRLDAV